jgi:RNA polymerase sigma factor (sigma-70 family)
VDSATSCGTAQRWQFPSVARRYAKVRPEHKARPGGCQAEQGVAEASFAFWQLGGSADAEVSLRRRQCRRSVLGRYILVSYSPTRSSHVTRSGVLRHRIDVEASDGEVYRKYADDLTRFATGLVGPSDAADVVSDAVLSCFGSPGWSSVHEKRSYLYRSVFNRAAELRRATSRRRAREERVALPDLIDPPEVRPEVLGAVQQLSVQQRAVIVLTYWEDLGPSAVAHLMGITEGAVRRHLARARSRLKEELRTND